MKLNKANYDISCHKKAKNIEELKDWMSILGTANIGFQRDLKKIFNCVNHFAFALSI